MRINTHSANCAGISLFCVAIFACLLAACSHRAPAEASEKPAEKKDENIVRLTKENLEHTKIESAAAALGRLELTLKAAGRVSENGNRTAKVLSTLEGRISKLNADLDDRVQAGEVLALVQTPELLGKPLEIKAPIDGVITDRQSIAGELVTKETLIYTISDPADLWVLAEIRERDIGAVRIGQEVTFSVLAYPDQFHGRIVRIGNRVEEASRTLDVRIETRNPDGRLKPGMFAEVEIVTTVEENVLLIPDTALQTNGEETIAFAELGGGQYEKRALKTGLQRHGQVQILEGIRAGEKIVTTGSFILKSELLKAALGDD